MGFIRNWRRRRVRRREFPAHWRPILEEYVPFTARIPADLVAKFEGDLYVFSQEKTFVGAAEFEITEEVEVVIAAAAARLVVHLDIDAYDSVNEVIVYPTAYQHPESENVILGQVNDWGVVILSWDDVVAGLANPRDGNDTATHEFAHVLDRESGAFNGTPTLRAHDHYDAWGRVLSAHYLRLRKRGGKGSKVLRAYAATNEAEFFAVATEVFFERPGIMKRRAPDLYEELRRYYGFDPANG